MQICSSRFFRGCGSSSEGSLNAQNETENIYVNNVHTVNMIKRKRIRRKRTGKIMHQNKALSFLSCNVSSIQNKMLSLEKIVNDLDLAFFALQETHQG